MVVWRNLAGGQLDCFNAAGLPNGVAAGNVHGDPPTQIRQGKRVLAVTAVGRSDQVEQRVVLGNGEQLPFAKGPPCWCKVAREHANFANVRYSHVGEMLIALQLL